MLTCRTCGCYCDPSDLIGMVCDNCREKERKEQEHKQEMERLAKLTGEQIRLEEFWR